MTVETAPTAYDIVVRELKLQGYEVSEENNGWYYNVSKIGYKYTTELSSINELEAFLKGVESTGV